MITVSTNEIANHFSVLSNLSKTNPVIAIEMSRKDKLLCITAGSSDDILVKIKLKNNTVNEDAVLYVNYEAFQNAIVDCGKTFELRISSSHLNVIGERTAHSLDLLPEDRRLVFLQPSKCSDHNRFSLPTNFQNFIRNASQCVSNDPDRPVLHGICISGNGIAATNGHELYHVELPIGINGGAVIRYTRPLALLMKQRWSSMSIWGDDNIRHFQIEGENFIYSSKAIDGLYPNFKSVIPDAGTLDAGFEVTEINSSRIVSFINGLEKKSAIDLQINQKTITLNDGGNHKMTVEALCEGQHLPMTIGIQSENLKHLLQFGFNSLCVSSSAVSPILAKGGVGTYVFMPMREPVTAADAKNVKSPKELTIIQQTQTNNKENEKMNTTSVNLPVPVRPTQPITNVSSTENSVSPLDEALAAFAQMREQIAALEARLQETGRKIKTALLEQKQKERIYADAVRKLERVRAATAC